MKNASKTSRKMTTPPSLLVCDYDGTLATDGAVTSRTLEALRAMAESGLTLVLATGRELDDLISIFPEISLFAWVIAENGAVIFETATSSLEVKGEVPPKEFLRVLKDRGVKPIAIGKAIVATSHIYAGILEAEIKRMHLSHKVILNKDSAMVLPRGVNKGSALSSILKKLGRSEKDVVGVGDGENDVDLFRTSGFRVAVANAVPELKEAADWVSSGEAGEGIEQLSELLLSQRVSRR